MPNPPHHNTHTHIQSHKHTYRHNDIEDLKENMRKTKHNHQPARPSHTHTQSHTHSHTNTQNLDYLLVFGPKRRENSLKRRKEE